MGTLYLVRHGQASFGSADYDQLSPLGVRQCEALGAWFAAHGIGFGGVWRGTLRRHAQSLEAFARGYGGAMPPAAERPGLNEYDSLALIRAVHAEPLPPPTSPAAYREHFRLLRLGLEAWIAARTAPEGMPTHEAFLQGIVSALDEVRARPDEDTILFSSGGPIAAAVAHVLGAAREVAIDLNLRIRNSAVTEFAVTPRRHLLVAHNHLPHLAAPERRDWITFT
jgi:broad specificity phosphatase PhoE